MPIRDWLRPPRQVIVVFLAVALVSAGGLGWLAWQLLAQEKALEIQRRQERLEQAADRAAAVMQQSLADLQARAGPQSAPSDIPPSGVSVVSIGPGGATVTPAGSILYYAFPTTALEVNPTTFAEGERAEFLVGDLKSAADFYARLAVANEVAVRAGALTRLARIHRKQGEAERALGVYDELARLDEVAVDGLPATLVARVGRASVFDEGRRVPELRVEAIALRNDLRGGRWHLVKSEYEFYARQAREWLGDAPPEDADALARTEALAWLWQNRASNAASGRRLVAISGGSALLAWQSPPDGLHAVVAGPNYLTSLSNEAVASDFRWALSDQDGRIVLGATPPAREVAVRTALAARLPWTLHVFENPDLLATQPSPRRQLLLMVFAVVGLVLTAGWYFTLRAISRELRVSRLQSDFVAAVSHEFRSPLTSLSHIAEMLAHDRFPSDDLRRRSYDVLVRDTDRLRRLVEGLLDFGRFEAGAGTLRLETIDVAGLVRATVTDFRERVAPEGYSVELADSVADTADPTVRSGASGEPGQAPLGSTLRPGAGGQAIYARVDREALSRALWNLLDNAVKYSPDCRTVWVELTRHPDRVAIVVRDQGLGIPVREQREIFDRFVRGADSKARHIKGTGIGLAMVRQIVQAHGGEVRLDSEVARGSAFTISLPATMSVPQP